MVLVKGEDLSIASFFRGQGVKEQLTIVFQSVNDGSQSFGRFWWLKIGIIC
jgi:hypothetical protein